VVRAGLTTQRFAGAQTREASAHIAGASSRLALVQLLRECAKRRCDFDLESLTSGLEITQRGGQSLQLARNARTHACKRL
jgi:hypothetical protein